MPGRPGGPRQPWPRSRPVLGFSGARLATAVPGLVRTLLPWHHRQQRKGSVGRFRRGSARPRFLGGAEPERRNNCSWAPQYCCSPLASSLRTSAPWVSTQGVGRRQRNTGKGLARADARGGGEQGIRTGVGRTDVGRTGSVGAAGRGCSRGLGGTGSLHTYGGARLGGGGGGRPWAFAAVGVDTKSLDEGGEGRAQVARVDFSCWPVLRCAAVVESLQLRFAHFVLCSLCP
mmetsp:Transcript_34069/g.62288  ORF Transcript_34069/g.62288 Transcript_34069/m.62288 type:complete len:231 (-) Transcript_34069:256-948(-)